MTNNELGYTQNFIRKSTLAKRLIDMSNLSGSDIVLEIGPGKGIFTKHLAHICAKVIAIEYDHGLYERLKITLGTLDNVELHCEDFLTSNLPKGNYKVFANIPFNITSAVLAKLTTGKNPPIDAYLVIQQEPAMKYAGQPYYHETLRSLIMKPVFEVTILHYLRRTDFTPMPMASSVLLHIHRRQTPILSHNDYRKYRNFLCYTFSEPGKSIEDRTKHIFTKLQLRRLAHDHRFAANARPIDLSFEQWLALFRFYATYVTKEKQGMVEGAEYRLIQQQRDLNKIHRNRRIR